MSTRYSVGKRYGRENINLGYEGSAVPKDFVIPGVGLEDVDRAMFSLFDKDLPLVYRQKDGSTKKVPVIFATGERFAITRRKQPLRDKNGAIILPLITIQRSGISQEAQKIIEMGDQGTIDIKRRLSDEDPIYQRIANSLGLQSAESPGAGSRRDSPDRPGRMTGGRLLEPNLGAGIYETISIPVPKFFTATYEITLWTQFMQHSNEILTAIISGYHNIRARSYRIEASSGYWFNATFDADVSSENTFDSMSEDERAIKHTLKASVPAFIILPSSPGIPNGVRRTVSATQFSFGIIDGTSEPEPPGNVSDMRIDSRILDPVSTVDGPEIVGSIGSQVDRQAERAAGGNQRVGSSAQEKLSTAVGGTESASLRTRSTTRRLTIDPITGKEMDVIVKVRRVSESHGEEVLTTVTRTAKSDKDSK
jgi:hypothetical protein